MKPAKGKVPAPRLPSAITVNHSGQQVMVLKSELFDSWLRGVRDHRAVSRIQVRIDRLASGNPGDVKPVGKGVSELRIDTGPGYRVYFVRDSDSVVVLLAGGNKSSQSTDIDAAQRLAEAWKEMKQHHD